MFKIGILEDEKEHQERLKQYLSKYQSTHSAFAYTLEVFDRALQLLSNYTRDYHILFLDIRLPDMMGIDAARKIRETDENVMIIFVTNLTQYAIDGYSVNAFDYVLKPLSYGAFSSKLDRALRMLGYRSAEIDVVVKGRTDTMRLSSDVITYIEVQNHDLLIHTADRTLRQWGSLARMEEQLQNAHFVRCSVSYLVNLKYVQGIQKNQVLVGGKLLTISKLRKKEFLSALTQYKGGSLWW